MKEVLEIVGVLAAILGLLRYMWGAEMFWDVMLSAVRRYDFDEETKQEVGGKG